MTEYHTIRSDADISDEIVALALDIVDGWYPSGRVDWGDLWDRLDGAVLDSGAVLDLGNDLAKLEPLKRRVKKARQ